MDKDSGLKLFGALFPFSVLSFGQTPGAAPTTSILRPSMLTEIIQFSDMLVQESEDSLVGIADSASQGMVGARQLQLRSTMRTGEVLKTIPGMITTQHAGGGKANQ